MAVEEEEHREPEVVVVPESKKNTLIDYGVKGALILLALWGGKKILDNMHHNNQESKTASDPATQQAGELRSAMNPSGVKWLWAIDGKDSTSIFNVGEKITDFPAVIAAYRNLYNGDSLTDDLKGKLSASDYQRFMNIFNYGKNKPKDNQTKSAVDYSSARIAVSKSKVNLRKTAKYYGTPGYDKLLIYKRSNVIKTVDPNTAIGVTTGKSSFDDKALPVGTLFIEVTVLQKDAATSDSFKAWVAASQVNTMTVDEFRKANLPTLAITKEEYDAASTPVDGLGAINYNREIITLVPTPVLDDEFKPVTQVGKGIILGFPVMELKAHDKTYVKFLTIDDTQRWVNKNNIKITNK